MSRPLRIEYANAYYHVMNRGAGRRKIFNNDQDRIGFLTILSDAHLQYNIEVHSYCLMTNHYHMLLKTPSSNLARAMRHINGVYTQRYNRLNGTDGPLFRGRYKSILVESDAYLLHLSKYIHLNPIGAKMVRELSDFKWSSYPAFIGNCPPPPWLYLSEIYGQLTLAANKKELYRLFMMEPKLNEEIVNFFSKERIAPILGNEAFKSSLQDLNQSEETPRNDKLFNRPTITRIIEETAREFSQNTELLFNIQKGRGHKNIPRKIAMYIAKKVYDYRLKEIAKAFGLNHYGAAANSIFILSSLLIDSPELITKLKAINNRLDPNHQIATNQ